MELQELQGRGRVYLSLYPGKYSAMELGCYTLATGLLVLLLYVTWAIKTNSKPIDTKLREKICFVLY